MNHLKAPQVFHNKPEKTNEHFVMFTNELFAAINTLFSGNEAKIMLASCGSSALREINDGEFKNRIRSTIFKNILINIIQF